MSKRSGLFALLAVMAFAACCGCSGSDSVTGPAPVAASTPPPAPVTTTIIEGTISDLPPRYVTPIPFSTLSSGTLVAVVNWTYAECDVDVGLVRGSCTLEQINGGTCAWAALSTSRTAKPERVSAPAPPGDYTLYVFNNGPETEALSFYVTLTTGAAASGEAPGGPQRLKGAFKGTAAGS